MTSSRQNIDNWGMGDDGVPDKYSVWGTRPDSWKVNKQAANISGPSVDSLRYKLGECVLASEHEQSTNHISLEKIHPDLT